MNFKKTLLGWIFFVFTSWFVTYLDYRYGNTVDGIPEIASKIVLYVIFPVSIIVFYFGSNRKSTLLKTIFWKIFIVGIQAGLGFLYLVFLMILYCTGGCL